MHSYALWVLILSVSQLPCPTVSGKSSSPLSVDYDLVPFTIRRQLHWTSLIDWHNPANWLPDRRLPCAKDRIALPEDFLLFLNHQLDATELVLPQNGELVLGPQGNIRLLTQPDGELAASCPSGVSGSNLEFTPSEKSHPSSWFSPLNWRLVFPPPERGNTQGTWGAAKQRAISNFATFLTPGRDGVAAIVPHSERIPCTGDWVHFPTTNGSFKVTIERSSQVPTLRQLSIGPLLFGSSTRFNEYVKSFRGELLFDIGDYNHLQISERLSGQSCGNDSPKKLANICLHVQSTCRERDALPCADPITPKGHCCPLCASALIAKSNGSTDLAQRILETALRANHRLLPYLRLYGHQLYDGRWQVIVEDLPVDGSIRGEHLNDAYIQKLKATLRYFNFQVHSVSSSVLWLEDSHLLGTIVWICFALFLLSMASYPLYTYYQRNRLDPAFTFVRFRSHTSDIELEGVDLPGGIPHSEVVQEKAAFGVPTSGPITIGASSAPPSGIKSFLAPFSPPSIASIKSILSGGGSSTGSLSRSSSSLFPIAHLAGGGGGLEGSGNRSAASTSLTENFDNPIFRLFSQSQEPPQPPTMTTMTMEESAAGISPVHPFK